MDFHAEQIVTKKRTSSDNMLMVLIVLATVILWFLTLAFLSIFPTVAALLFFGIGWGALKLLQMLNLEYEYEITNYYIDIDKIIGKARRKEIMSIDLRTAEFIGYTTADEFLSSSNIEKKYDFSGNPKADGRIFIDFTADDGMKKRVILRPNEKITEYIKKAAPRVQKLS